MTPPACLLETALSRTLAASLCSKPPSPHLDVVMHPSDMFSSNIIEITSEVFGELNYGAHALKELIERGLKG